MLIGFFFLGEIISVFYLETIFILLGIPTLDAFSIKPAQDEIFSNQLCPNPTTKSPSKDLDQSVDILAINLDKPRDSSHVYESCTFKQKIISVGGAGSTTGKTANGGRALANVRVRSINFNTKPWNYTEAQQCSDFVKFNDWDEHDGGRYQVLCGRENFDPFLGPSGHPMVLYYQWKNGGLSFPLFHTRYTPELWERKNTLELNYMQIYFIISINNTRRCRVQQYRLDLLRRGCSTIAMQEQLEPMCGTYDCSDLESLYQAKMTIFKSGDNDNDTVLVWKTNNTSEKYRMRTFLRQKFVPVVFLVVLVFAYRSYMKAGLRFQSSMHDDIPEVRVRSVRLRRTLPTLRVHSTRDAAIDPYWIYDEEETPYYNELGGGGGRSRCPAHGHQRHASTATTADVPGPSGNIGVGGKGSGTDKDHEDPPPSYESLSPPTYSEATIIKAP